MGFEEINRDVLQADFWTIIAIVRRPATALTLQLDLTSRADPHAGSRPLGYTSVWQQTPSAIRQAGKALSSVPKENGFSIAIEGLRGLIDMSSRKWKVWLLSAIATLLCQQGLHARSTAPPQDREEPPFDLQAGLGTIGDWRAVVTAAVEPQGEIVSDEGPSESRICFVRTVPAMSECTYFRDLFHSNLKLQVFSSLTAVRLQSESAATNGLELKAVAWYSTGQVRETAIWVYDAQRDDFHLVLAVESGEVRIFSSGLLNGMLVTSDWRRDEGDTRWSAHRRDITVYRYGADGEEAGYRKVLEYITTKKYGAEDTDTIDAELTNIEAKLP